MTFLAERPGLWFDDDELSRLLGIKPRQQIYILCRHLHDTGRIRREVREKKLHNSALLPSAPSAVASLNEPAPVHQPYQPDQPLTPALFERLAEQVLADYFQVSLTQRSVPGVPKRFDLVSADYTVVGDAKFYTLVNGESLPPAKFSVIAEHVWLLERTPATHRFLVFGNDRRVPELWLKRYGHLVRDVAFFYLTDGGDLALLN